MRKPPYFHTHWSRRADKIKTEGKITNP